MTTSQELIVALEKATGPDRELDALIYCATNAPPEGEDKIWAVGVDVFWAGGTVKQGPLFLKGVNLPAYTSSIDAAMTLALRGWIISIERGFDDDGEYWSKVVVVNSHSIGRGCDPSERIAFVSSGPGEPPRYIAAAFLKSRATSQSGE